MFTRIFGLSAVAIGVCCLVFGVYGAVKAASMGGDLLVEANAGVIALDPADWIARWRESCLMIAAAGAVAIVGGTMILKGRPLGFLLVAVIAVLLAVLPWIGQALGATRYAFEQASLAESLAEGAIAVAALVAYGRSRRIAA